MNSTFPRNSQPVSSDRRRSRINGVFPTYTSTPEYFPVTVLANFVELGNQRCHAHQRTHFAAVIALDPPRAVDQ